MTSNGYTARVARVIAASTGADVFEVETAEPYPAGYRNENSYLRERCSQTREHPRFLFT